MTNPNSTRILKTSTYGLETSPDGQELFLCRYKKPGWRLRLDDAATDKTKLATTLRKAAEWLSKRHGLPHTGTITAHALHIFSFFF